MKKRKNDLIAKALTLVIAIFLWSYVMSEANPEITREYRNITVNFTNTSALDRQGLVIMDPEEVKINVKVNGNKVDMDKFVAANIFAQIDLSGYSEGQVKIPVTVGLLDQASGIRVLSYEPKEVLFTFDRIVTKEIPVEVTTIGELASEHIIGDIAVRPQSILLSGPRTWVNEVAKAVAIIDITGKSELLNLAVPVKIVNDNNEEVRGIEKNPGIIDMTIPVFRTVTLPVELKTTGELPENFSLTNIEINPSHVMVKGGPSITELTKIDTVEIDVNTLLEASAIDVSLDFPEGVSLVDQNQKITVTYVIEETETLTLEFLLEEAEIINLDDTLDILEEDLLKNVIVQLTGYKSLLETLTIEDLKPTLDLEGLEKGSHEIELLWIAVDGVKIENIVPQFVTINLFES